VPQPLWLARAQFGIKCSENDAAWFIGRQLKRFDLQAPSISAASTPDTGSGTRLGRNQSQPSLSLEIGHLHHGL
jgi:hypothetical protein